MSSKSSATNPAAAEKDDGARGRILDSALRLLADEGHSALTVRRVAAEANCSTIGVYTWFGGKDGLVDAIWIDGFQSFSDALRDAQPQSGPLGRLRSQAMAYRSWALLHPRHYRVMFMQAIVDHVPSTEATLVSLSAFTALQEAVAEAAAKNELRSPDLDAVAMACWGTAHGLVAIELTGAAPPRIPGVVAPESLAERSYQLAIDSLVFGFSSSP